MSERIIDFRIEETVDLGSGRRTTVVYLDHFDPDKLREIVGNKNAPLELRRRSVNRLLNANVASVGELQQLVNDSQEKL